MDQDPIFLQIYLLGTGRSLSLQVTGVGQKSETGGTVGGGWLNGDIGGVSRLPEGVPLSSPGHSLRCSLSLSDFPFLSFLH